MANIPKRSRARSWPPKGSYPHPAGGHILRGKRGHGNRIQVTGHLRAEPDTKKLAEAIVRLAGQLGREERQNQRDKSE